MKIARGAGLVLCIIGLLLMGRGLYEAAGGRIYQEWRGRELDRALETLPPQPAPQRRHVSFAPGSAIGRLEIPRIGISVVVLEGSDASTLRLGVGRLPNSSVPGEAGNVVLAGHRDTFFRALRQIRSGDTISLRTPQGTFPYTVDWTQVVNPTDTAVLQPTPSPALTLVTCYPFYYIGSAPQRFIVRALPVAATLTTSAVPVAAPAAVIAAQVVPVSAPVHLRRRVAPASVRPTPPVPPVEIASAPAPAPVPLKPEPEKPKSTAAVQPPPPFNEAVAEPAQPSKHGLGKLNPRGTLRKITALLSGHRSRTDQQ